jgi:hypothetical protein
MNFGWYQNRCSLLTPFQYFTWAMLVVWADAVCVCAADHHAAAAGQQGHAGADADAGRPLGSNTRPEAAGASPLKSPLYLGRFAVPCLRFHMALTIDCHAAATSLCTMLTFSSSWVPQIAKKPYQFLLISALREYLTLEFEPPAPLAFPYDPERIIDDFGARRWSYSKNVHGQGVCGTLSRASCVFMWCACSLHVLLRGQRLPAAHADAGDPGGRHRPADVRVPGGAAPPGRLPD